MRKLFNSAPIFWLLLAVPGAAMLQNYWSGAADAMDMLHPTGETSARLLIAALAITPLMGLTRRAAWVRWLAARRRYIGVAAFIYALAHLGFYIVDMGDLGPILDEVLLPGIWTGWVAFLAMLALALTSNDASMRAFRAGWKRLQRLAYPVAVLTLAHWVLVFNGSTAAWLHFAPLALLEILRLRINFRKVVHHA